MSETPNSQSGRDASSIRILGIFFLVMGVLVWIGTFWALDDGRAVTVNLLAGLALSGAGVVSQLIARRMGRAP